MKNLIPSLLIIFFWTTPPLKARESYRVERFNSPPGVVCETTGLDYTQDGTLYLCTRQGDVWSEKKGQWNRFAYGLHEPMGLCIGKEGEVYVSQRPEITQLIDEDGDNICDYQKTICADFSMETNFHQYTYGLIQDRTGNLFGTLSCAGLTRLDGTPGSARGYSPTPYRMWSYQVTPNGQFIPWSAGLRSANGIGFNLDGDLFAADNQGDWVATSMLHHLNKGDFHGHPEALRWDENFTHRKDPENAPIKLLAGMRKPPAVHFPHGELANSPGSPICDTTAGKFGPFAGQLFIGDIVHPRIIRVALEKVNGQYQGACFSFYHAKGLKSGICRLTFSPDGALIVGRAGEGNWARGLPGRGLQKIAYTGTDPFEIHRINLIPDGFTFHFTQPLALDLKAKSVNVETLSYRYQYGPNYGYPKSDKKKIVPDEIIISKDRKSVQVKISGLEKRKIYQFSVMGVRNQTGQSLRNSTAHYTLNELPNQ